MVIIIEHELYGETTQFNSIEQAQKTLRDMGDGWETVTLRMDLDGTVFNEDDEIVGYRVEKPGPQS